MIQHTSLSDFLLQHLQGMHATALNAMVEDIAHACKAIGAAIDVGALEGNMGTLGTENVQGEEQKALDMIANDLFIKSVQQNGYVAGLASEEMDEVIEVEEAKHPHGQYIVLFDPLDGSSNVNVNISVGTIFSILNSENAHPTNADYLQAGTTTITAWLLGSAIGFFNAAIMLVNNTRDISTDTKAGKNTLAVRIGESQAKVLYQSLVYLPFGIIIAGFLLGSLDGLPVLLAGISLVIARNLSREFHHNSGEALNPILGKTAKLTMIFSVLFSVGFFFSLS